MRSPVSAPSFSDPDNFERFRSVLEGAGYTDKGVIEALGVKDFPSVRGDDLPVLLRRTSQGTPVDTFVRLFLMQVPVDREVLLQAIRISAEDHGRQPVAESVQCFGSWAAVI